MAEKMLVTCLAHTGYRRAGMAFEKGANHLEAAALSESQLAAIEADPRLKVVATEGEGPLDNKGVGSGLDSAGPLDLTSVPEELTPFVAVIDHLAREGELTEGKKPKVDELTFEAPSDEGNTIKVKPTAAQRDAAWELYQKLTQQADDQSGA